MPKDDWIMIYFHFVCLCIVEIMKTSHVILQLPGKIPLLAYYVEHSNILELPHEYVVSIYTNVFIGVAT